MAEKHQKTTITSVGDAMYAIFQMVTTSGQTAIRWADNTDTHAIYSGSAFIAASSVTSTTFNNTASYMVIESSAAMPSGRRWQAKISRGGANTNLYVNFAPRGSWNYLTPGFDTANYPYTGDIDAWAASTTSGRVLISTSDLDTYGSGTTYSYLRLVVWDSAGTAMVKSFYVGGYIPFDQTNNLNPAVLLARNPVIAAGATNTSWGFSTSGANCINRIPPDYTGAAKNLTAQGYAHCATLDTSYAHRDMSGNWANLPVYVRCIDDSGYAGYFGKYTMFAGDQGRTLATADSAGEYLTCNDLVLRWKPTA